MTESRQEFDTVVNTGKKAAMMAARAGITKLSAEHKNRITAQLNGYLTGKKDAVNDMQQMSKIIDIQLEKFEKNGILPHEEILEIKQHIGELMNEKGTAVFCAAAEMKDIKDSFAMADIAFKKGDMGLCLNYVKNAMPHAKMVRKEAEKIYDTLWKKILDARAEKFRETGKAR